MTDYKQLCAELVQQLADGPGTWLEKIVNAYLAGADQELEACCEWLQDPDLNVDTYKLRAARRPKPPSPKEEALQVLENLLEARRIVDPEYQALRHALEQLDD